MKNRVIRFTCADKDKLTVSLSAGKKDYAVVGRHRYPSKDGNRTEIVTLFADYFEKEAQAEAAEAKFQIRIEEALKQGWSMVKNGMKEIPGSIPPAPGVARRATDASSPRRAGTTSKKVPPS